MHKNALNTYKKKVRPDIQSSIGEILGVCSKDVVRRNIDIKTFLHWIKPAVLHGQFQLFKSEGSVYPTGYLTWALVDDDTLTRYLNEPRFILHPSEWYEGQHFVVVDFCSLGNSAALIRQLLKSVRATQETVHICIRNDRGMPVKSKSIQLIQKKQLTQVHHV
ncbi:MAG: toxin-activating lysine-acyltransferase [Proteobacteria bacterium]|nr:toxin-activating lysine-acyltransferase [Pseudomonadota bacterium]